MARALSEDLRSRVLKASSDGMAIEQAGAELHYLPPYSPDFNPIEMAFAKLKSLLRARAERSVDGL